MITSGAVGLWNWKTPPGQKHGRKTCQISSATHMGLVMPKTDSCPFAGTTTVARGTDKDAAFWGIKNRHVAQPLLGAGSMLWRKMCKYSVRRYGNLQPLSCGEVARRNRSNCCPRTTCLDLEMCPLSEVGWRSLSANAHGSEPVHIGNMSNGNATSTGGTGSPR